MSFHSFPLTVREIKATEATLERIYNAAKLGLKNDNLALAAGLRPVEYRQLCQCDPLAELAAEKGRADGEREMATTLYTAAQNGDSKAALSMLQHAHNWVAKQQIDVSVDNRISILAALEQAEARVIEGQALTVLDSPSPAPAPRVTADVTRE